MHNRILVHEPGTSQAVLHGVNSRNLKGTNCLEYVFLCLPTFSILMHRHTMTPDFKKLRGLTRSPRDSLGVQPGCLKSDGGISTAI